LSSASGTINVEWECGSIESTTSGWYEETYDVIATTSNAQGTITSTTPAFGETLPGGETLYARSADISAMAGQASVYITFRHHNCTDENILGIDNIVVKTPLANDAQMMTCTAAAFVATGNTVTIAGDIMNNGSNTITAMDVTWDDGTGPYTDNLTGLSIAAGATYAYSHATQLNVAAVTAYNLTVSVSLVGDADPSNDAINHTVSGLAFIPTRYPVIEEGTGTWCGWCPRGAVAMDYMTATYTDFIGVAVHNGDPMTVTAYDNGAGFSGFPGMNVNRKYLGESVSSGGMESFYNQTKAEVTIADITITGANMNMTTRDLQIDVSSLFAADVNTEHRFACVLVESGITGTSSGYDQANYYAGGGSGVMGGYENLSDPVPAAQMTYDHVGVALIGGYAGQSGSIPASNLANSTASYTFNYTVPATVDENNCKVVAMIINSATGEIMNARETNMMVVGVQEISALNKWSVYPNPTTGNSFISYDLNAASDVSVEVIGMLGQVVFTQNLGEQFGAQVLNVNLSGLNAGIYMVNLVVDGKTVSKRINLMK
jgi:hypothetical protein